ncbi:MAG: SUMF1/EgtB/PvdO family nonheme iron enzyme [Anaerolineae bacterium]|nr:SUMF1/EgtB/PvdO family nonheme iron enzyme [Anaerolineae bacterium]
MSLEDDLLNLLSPFMGTESERRAQITLAFGTDSPIERQINFSGATDVFILNLIRDLKRYGDFPEGTPALWTLMLSIRNQVGEDKQRQIDGLREQGYAVHDEPIPVTPVPNQLPASALEWGLDVEIPTADPDSPLDEGIILDLLAQYPVQQGRIVKREVISSGLSGASVFLVTIQVDALHKGYAYAKIDHHPRIVRECRIHRSVKQSPIAPYVPELLCEPLGPVKGWSAVVYQPAAGTVEYARSLDGILTTDTGALEDKTAPLYALLQQALGAWHTGMYILPTPQNPDEDRRNWVPNLLEEMINLGGKNRLGEALRDRVREHGLATDGSPRLTFSNCDLVFPNPIAYILTRDYWLDRARKPIQIDAPRCPVHGDLHGGNLICETDDQQKLALPKAPWLIDFALSRTGGIPFYDLAYLEIDILLRRMKTRKDHPEDWSAWVEMTQFLASGVLPDSTLLPEKERIIPPKNETLRSIWSLIRPIRETAATLIARGENRDSKLEFERAFWLAGMAAGVMATRRSRMEPPEKHKASLLYGAWMLKKLLDRQTLTAVGGTVFHVDWTHAPLNEDMVRQYYQDAKGRIINEFRKEFYSIAEADKDWSITLGGTLTPHRDDTPLKGQVEAEFEDDPALAEWVEALGRRGAGHLEGDKPDTDLPKALDEVTPISDEEGVTGRLMKLSRAVLIGEPGAGKTVTLEQLMVRYARAREEGSHQPIPALVPLARFNGEQTFAEFARGWLHNLKAYAEDLPLVWLLDALNEMPQTGLKKGDRTPRQLLPEVIQFLQDELTSGEQKKLDRRFVLSCRVADYGDELRAIRGVDKISLRALSPPQIERVIRLRLKGNHAPLAAKLLGKLNLNPALLRAYEVFAKAGQEDEFWEGKPGNVPYDVAWAYFRDDPRLTDYQKRLEAGESLSWDKFAEPFAEDMITRKHMLQDERGLLKLCRNPFDLSLVIKLAAARGVENLPTDRAGLMIETAEGRLLHEEKEGLQRKDPTWIETVTRQQIKDVLTHVAEVIQATEQRTEISAAEALAAVGHPEASSLLRKAERAALITYRDTIRFGHQLWQEYFAALRMLQAMQVGQDPARFFGETWWDPGAWRESLRFLIQVSDELEKVIRWLAPYAPEAAADLWAAYRPPEMETNKTALDSGESKPDAGSLVKVLRRAAEAKAEYGFSTHTWREVNPDPRGRASAWRVLGILPSPSESVRSGHHAAVAGMRASDPRPGVLDFNWDEDYWCLVPKGEYIYQAEPEQINYDFWIARYPITYAQFELFIDAPDGYHNPDWWKDLHEKGRAQQQRGAGEQNFKFGNHPRETVSWYDAVAFCRWLNALTPTRPPLGVHPLPHAVEGAKYVIRLPLETEWEKAASWDAKAKKARVYPWGDDFDPTKANTNMWKRIGQTTAVGIYPQGEAPCGALDMSGNVWEWCLNEYESGQVNIGSNETRSLRGGSWRLYSTSGFRCDFRVRDFPVNRDTYGGFRVVWAPISLGFSADH